MTLAIDAVRDTGKVAEATICYTGDILDKNRTKYDLAYYTSMAKELEVAEPIFSELKIWRDC